MAGKSEEKELRSLIDVRRGWLDRSVIAIGDFLGSIGFLVFCLLALGGYILWNLGLLPGLMPVDPFPFNGLSSVLSMFALVISICVLISQNRLRRLEKIREQVEFEINVKAETEITKMLEMLHEIQKKMGIHKEDPELEEMKETIDIQELHNHIDEKSTD